MEIKVEVPKELNDCLVMLVELVKDIKDKKELAVIVSENLPNLIAAIDGAQKIPEELKGPGVYKAAGLFAGEIVEALVK